MVKKDEKSSITPEQRLNWLIRNEEGESPPQIAKKDSYDVRTIRKHIEIARQQREIKEARSMVLRNALEQHYRDLCEFAQGLVGLSPKESSAWTPNSEYMEIALRQHLPRSPIWNYLKQRNKLQRQITELIEKSTIKIEEGVKSDLRLKTKLTESESGPVDGIRDSLIFQIEQYARGYHGLSIQDNLLYEPLEEGFFNIRYGGYQMGRVSESHLQNVYEIISEVLKDWEERIKQFDEYLNLEKSFRELRNIEKKLSDEIAVITLRRVVPGRCRYCPL